MASKNCLDLIIKDHEKLKSLHRFVTQPRCSPPALP
jgi:hypothetical protein